MFSDYETPQLQLPVPAPSDNTYEMLRLSAPYESLRATVMSTGTAMYASILEPSMPAINVNGPADATATDAAAATADNNYGYEILKPSSAYELLQLPAPNGIDGHSPTRQYQLAVPRVHVNRPPAATATDAAAGVDSDSYQISIPTERTETPSHAYIEILPNQIPADGSIASSN